MPYRTPDEATRKEPARLQHELMAEIDESPVVGSARTPTGAIRYQEFSLKGSKPILDQIDRTLDGGDEAEES